MNWKLSKYLIISEPIVNEKYQVLYSTRTARKMLLPVKLVDNILKNDIESITEEGKSLLILNEILVPSEEDELAEILRRNTNAIAENETLYYVIQPTAQCQLGCKYCGQKHTGTYLNDNLNSLILKRVQEKLAYRKYKTLQIGWFGAEPLLGAKQMEKLTPSLKSLANEHGCIFFSKVVTNGLNLKIDLFHKLVEWDVKSIEITLDGSAKYHDQRRHTKSGHNTFDIIFKNLYNIFSINNFESLGVEIIIRCNVDVNNYEGVTELIKLLGENNFLSKISGFYTAPIHSWGNDAHLNALSIEEFANLEVDWIIALQEQGFVKDQVPSKTNPIVCLSLHNDAEVIDAKGNVYNCTEVPYVPSFENSEYLLENLLDQGAKARFPRSFSNWNQEIAEGKYPCHQCKILPICGGACPKSWHEQISPCPSLKFNIKERLVLDAYSSLKNRGNSGNLFSPIHKH